MIKVQPTPLQLNKMVPTHTHKLAYISFVWLKVSMASYPQIYVTFLFAFFLDSCFFSMNLKNVKIRKSIKSIGKDKIGPTLVCCTSKQEYVIASFQIVPMFFAHV
jgi:hypothetical protein